MNVLAAARTRAGLEALAASAGDRVAIAEADMRDLPAVEALAAQAVETFGRLDVLVNNAGIAPAGAFLEATAEHLLHVMTVNLIAPSLLARAAATVFIGQGTGGKIINVASISGIRGKASLAAYSASKGALVQLTKALAAEWARHAIQVNAIAPGAFATEAQQAVLDSPDLNDRRLRKIPAKRWAQPSEIGPLTCYLASPLSDFVTGATFVIDGGETAKI
jgi:2-deoxy-D-gluconate 3-dehydrogenase